MASGGVRWNPVRLLAALVVAVLVAGLSVVALQALRQDPRRFGAVLALSSVVYPGESPGDAELAQRRPPVFWGMGAADTMFSPALVEHTAHWLPGHSTLTSHVYPGLGHGISQEELVHIHSFLEAWRDSVK